ncbi:hypothetical protein FF36_00086 [Frankia torreyi]|uniref:Uncharacterized protein n=1 Tax=Frankia torreyi TaxID=1856 RepID=A0A0D8BMN3_9ACTN|nr:MULTISPECIES: hypothetical protein [Frankia]KJE25473.1 hypothetical protein FF36_00086 [Frankia torreyi]KQM04833.1 hypothetical protein FF86_102288 [Frankia sp. CpI1-P]
MPELLLLGLFAVLIGLAAVFGPDTRDRGYGLPAPRPRRRVLRPSSARRAAGLRLVSSR